MITLSPYTSSDFSLLNQYFPDKEIGKYINRGKHRFLSMLGIYRSHLMLFKDDERLLGIGVIRWKWSRDTKQFGWWFYAIWVNPEFRGYGYGTILMKKLCDEMKTKHTKMVGLTVAKDNYAALNLYKKIGFRIIKDVNNEYVMQYDL